MKRLIPEPISEQSQSLAQGLDDVAVPRAVDARSESEPRKCQQNYLDGINSRGDIIPEFDALAPADH